MSALEDVQDKPIILDINQPNTDFKIAETLDFKNNFDQSKATIPKSYKELM